MNKQLILQTGLRFGIMLGLVSVILSVTFFFLSPESKWPEGLLGFAVLIGLVYVALNQFKTQNGDSLSIGEGMRVGFWMSLISGTISSVYKYLEMTYLNPEEFEKQMKLQRIGMEDQGMNEEQIDEAMKIAGGFTEPYLLIPMGILGSIIFVGIIALIVSAILKKERSVFE